MPKIHLVLGPVGAGKSTFARELTREHRALRLTLDEWMVTLFRPDRPDEGVMAWYLERTHRCIEQIWRITCSALEAGTDVILEIGLIRRDDRRAFYDCVDAASVDLVVYLLDAPREVRRARVARRNRDRGATFSMPVPPDVFELASDLWESPDAAEHAEREIRVVLPNAYPAWDEERQ